ncbi:MAG: hypothetical protein QM791_10790 [Ferruginibacter sp.]
MNHSQHIKTENIPAVQQDVPATETFTSDSEYAVLLFDKKGVFLSSNTVGLLMFGYAPRSIPSIRLADILPVTYTGELPLKSAAIKKINPVLAERQLVRIDGTTFSAAISAQVSSDGFIEVVMKKINVE